VLDAGELPFVRFVKFVVSIVLVLPATSYLHVCPRRPSVDRLSSFGSSVRFVRLAAHGICPSDESLMHTSDSYDSFDSWLNLLRTLQRLIHLAPADRPKSRSRSRPGHGLFSQQ
jgi:hypothetical protein